MEPISFLLEHWSHYCELDDTHRAWLARHVRTGTVKKGMALFDPDDPFSALFFVCRGLLATVWWDEQGRRHIERFLPPTHAALGRFNLYSSQPVPHTLYALRKSCYLSLPIAAFRAYKEHNAAANTLAHVLMARTAKQLHRKGRLLLIPNEVDRYTAFLRDDSMRALREITSQREHADYLNISKMSITRAMRRF